MNWKCNSCGATYSDTNPDGTAYYHVCDTEILVHGLFDSQGKPTQPATTKRRESIRDERPHPELTYVDGKPMRQKANPEDLGRTILTPWEYTIRSEGAGRTIVE